MDDRFIVAEISKTWSDTDKHDIISVQFEKVINVNLKRGYQLKDWRFLAAQVEIGYVETIIAVFEKTDNF